MASTEEFVTFVTDLIDDDCAVTSRKMFGEYGVYSGGKMFGVVCDDRLFVKPTEEGRAYIGSELVEAPAYPGARPSFLIEGRLEDTAWLSELVRITVRALPEPKPKKKRKKKG